MFPTLVFKSLFLNGKVSSERGTGPVLNRLGSIFLKHFVGTEYRTEMYESVSVGSVPSKVPNKICISGSEYRIFGIYDTEYRTVCIQSVSVGTEYLR